MNFTDTDLKNIELLIANVLVLVSEQTIILPKCKDDFNKCELLKVKNIHRLTVEKERFS